jgi:hypothetical protein
VSQLRRASEAADLQRASCVTLTASLANERKAVEQAQISIVAAQVKV